MSLLRLASLIPQTDQSRISEFIERLELEFSGPSPTEPTARRLSFHTWLENLCVSDLNFDEHGNAKRDEVLYANIHSPLRQTVTGGLRICDDNALLIPPAHPGGIRIFLAQGWDPKLSELHSEDGSAISRLFFGRGRKGYHGLSTQWETQVPETCFESTSFLLDSQSERQPGLMTCTKKVFILENSDGGLICRCTSSTHALCVHDARNQLTFLSCNIFANV